MRFFKKHFCFLLSRDSPLYLVYGKTRNKKERKKLGIYPFVYDIITDTLFFTNCLEFWVFFSLT